MSGKRRKRWKQAGIAGLGGFLIIGLLSLADRASIPLLMGSFGSSAVLILGFPDSGFCKPGRVIGAHVMCAAIGLLAFHGLGPHAWAEAAGVGACIAAMLGFRLVHPPAGSNPLIIFALKADWSYLFFPALFGSIGLVTLAWLWRKVSREGPGRPADS